MKLIKYGAWFLLGFYFTYMIYATYSAFSLINSVELYKDNINIDKYMCDLRNNEMECDYGNYSRKNR